LFTTAPIDILILAFILGSSLAVLKIIYPVPIRWDDPESE
jgi:hypothetical protein